VKDFDISKMKSLINVPFGSVPKELIECIHKGAYPPTYEEWQYWSPYFDKMSCYFNIALLDEERKMIAFQYGTWGPCGEGMHVIRVIIHPEYRENSMEIFKRGFTSVKKLAKELGMMRVYYVTSIWQHFLDKLPEYLEESNAKVLEVINV